MGVAIGSGIFRTPGEVAGHLGDPGLILLAWLLAGVVVLMQGLVSAELSTRFPEAGGEYVFLRETYGEFAAFFFGWAYTLFIIGGGAAAIALALGDFAVELLGIAQSPEPAAGSWHIAPASAFAAGAILLVTAINATGLRAGAYTQNTLTVLKVAALLTLIVCGFVLGGAAGGGWGSDGSFEATAAETATTAAATAPAGRAGLQGGSGDDTFAGGLLLALLAGLLPALWAYEGATDSVKMAEEIRDVRRALPRALVGATLTLIALYLLTNAALLRVIPADEMAQHTSVPGEAMYRLFGPVGRSVTLGVAIVVCLGSLSATVLATIRVTFAMARDRLAFRFLAGMSDRQAPVAALWTVGGFAVLLTLWRDFERVLGIYFFVAAILFGLVYASLLVQRRREAAFPEHAFRCPAGPLLALLLIGIQIALAARIAITQPEDMPWTLGLLAAFGVAYVAWRGVHRGRAGS